MYCSEHRAIYGGRNANSYPPRAYSCYCQHPPVMNASSDMAVRFYWKQQLFNIESISRTARSSILARPGRGSFRVVGYCGTCHVNAGALGPVADPALATRCATEAGRPACSSNGDAGASTAGGSGDGMAEFGFGASELSPFPTAGTAAAVGLGRLGAVSSSSSRGRF